MKHPTVLRTAPGVIVAALLAGIAGVCVVFLLRDGGPEPGGQQIVLDRSTTGTADKAEADIVEGTWPPQRKPRKVGVEILAPSYDQRRGGRDEHGFIGYVNAGVWIRYGGMDFGDGNADQFRAKVLMGAKWKTDIIVRIDRPNGPQIAQLQVQPTSGRGGAWQSTKLSQKVEGIHDLYITFKGSGANLYAFEISSSKEDVRQGLELLR